MSVNTLSRPRSADRCLESSSGRDEISLFDLWRVLLSRRWWLLGVWLATISAAVIYLVLAPPVFESRAVVRLGRVDGTLITPQASLVLALKERYQVGELGRKRPYLASVRSEGEDALVLVAEARSASQAQHYLERVLQALFVSQQTRYEAAFEMQEAALAVIETQISDLSEQARQLQESGAGEQVDEAVQALLILQRSSLQADLSGLNQQRLRLQQDLSLLRSYPSEAVREPTLTERASEPRPTLILVLALVLGAMLGCAVAFIVSFVHEGNRRARASSG